MHHHHHNQGQPHNRHQMCIAIASWRTGPLISDSYTHGGQPKNLLSVREITHYQGYGGVLNNLHYLSMTTSYSTAILFRICAAFYSHYIATGTHLTFVLYTNAQVSFCCVFVFCLHMCSFRAILFTYDS